MTKGRARASGNDGRPNVRLAVKAGGNRAPRGTTGDRGRTCALDARSNWTAVCGSSQPLGNHP